MALGGGVFTSQNKILPGSYINFVSMAAASATLSDRGVAAMGFVLDWGLDDDVVKVTAADFQKNCKVLFGYDYGHERLRPLREIFQHAHTVYTFRLNGAETGKATNEFATALHSGIRGNDLTIVISTNVDDDTKFDVRTVFDGVTVDEQTVTAAADLVQRLCDLQTAAVLTVTAGTACWRCDRHCDGCEPPDLLDAVEQYSFNAIGAVRVTNAANKPGSTRCMLPSPSACGNRWASNSRRYCLTRRQIMKVLST